MTEKINAGLDVGSETLVLALITQDKPLPPKTFENTKQGRSSLLKFLKKQNSLVRLCLEATGVYSIDIALILYQCDFVELMVVNPRAAKDFSRSLMRRTKTDLGDALMLAEYAKRMPFIPYTPPDKAAFQLRCLSRRIHALKKNRTQEKNRLHALNATKESSKFVKSDIEAHLKQLNKRIESLEKAALKLIESSPALKNKFKLLLSVAGIGKVSAISILGELCLFPEEMDVRQWVAYAGLDPKKNESGKFVGKETISRQGNKFLRHALFMPALVVSCKNEQIKKYYNKLLERGKAAKQALTAIMRKLLHAIFGVFRTNTSFDVNKCFSIAC